MDIDLSDEAVEYGRVARQALEAAGGDQLVQLAEQEPDRRERLVAPVLAELGAWDLDPRSSGDEAEAAAVLCRAAGWWAAPYPVAERLARPTDLDADGLVVVAGPAGSPGAGGPAPAAPLGGLAHRRWVAVTLDGQRHEAIPRPLASPPRKSAFATRLDLRPLGAGAPDAGTGRPGGDGGGGAGEVAGLDLRTRPGRLAGDSGSWPTGVEPRAGEVAELDLRTRPGGPAGDRGPWPTGVEPPPAEAAIDVALGLVLPCWTLLGMLDRAVDLTRGYVLERRQFGQPLAAFQGVQFQLTDAEVERAGVEELARHALWSLRARPHEAVADALALRLAAVEAADVVFRVAHQLHGATGFCDETTLSWLSRYSQPLRRLPLGLSATRDRLTRQIGRGGLSGLFDALATSPAGGGHG